jgi:hypothetical protein
MCDEELSGWIAENQFGPKPADRDSACPIFIVPEEQRRHPWQLLASMVACASESLHALTRYHWTHRDMVNDPAMTELLLDTMKRKGQSIVLNWGEDNDCWECSWITGGRRWTAVSRKRGRAVAEAWALAHGLSKESLSHARR